MKKFWFGFSAGLIAGVVLGAIFSVCAVVFWAKAMNQQQEEASAIDEKIEEKAAVTVGKYPSEAQIEDLAKVYLSDIRNFRLVIGISSNNHTRIFGFGRTSSKSPQAPDGDSIFEIGSITKTFTGLTLAIMATKKEI